jgi:hypothetical protein
MRLRSYVDELSGDEMITPMEADDMPTFIFCTGGLEVVNRYRFEVLDLKNDLDVYATEPTTITMDYQQTP